MTLASPSMADPEFQHALEEFATMQWRSGIKAEEIGSPQRIAPFSIAMALDFVEDDEELGTGRLILLHDPSGNENWEGRFRLVSYVAHRALAGTVTASYGHGFGELRTRQAEVEVRASWSPVLDANHRITVHLSAWQDLLGHISGRPPLPRGVVQFPGRA